MNPKPVSGLAIILLLTTHSHCLLLCRNTYLKVWGDFIVCMLTFKKPSTRLNKNNYLRVSLKREYMVNFYMHLNQCTLVYKQPYAQLMVKKNFPCNIGTRQGDISSPLLFALLHQRCMYLAKRKLH